MELEQVVAEENRREEVTQGVTSLVSVSQECTASGEMNVGACNEADESDETLANFSEVHR